MTGCARWEAGAALSLSLLVVLLGWHPTVSTRSLSLSLSQVFWSPDCPGKPPGKARIGQPAILISGPPNIPQDPNITGQQNLNLREFFLQYMAGIHKCVDRYTYTERWTQTDRKIDRQIER